MIWLCSITLADKSAKDKPPSVVGVSRLTLLDCLITWVYLDNTRTHMRVLFYMVICVSVFAENWGRFHGSLTPFAWLSMFRLPRQLTVHPYCAFGATSALADAFLCLLLPNDIRVLFHEKALFLRFSFSFTPLIPCLLSPRDEREMTERTPTQLPANKKCFLLRLLHWQTHLSWVLMLCTSPAKCLCQFPLHPFVKFLYTLAQLPKCHIADNQHLSYFGTPFE